MNKQTVKVSILGTVLGYGTGFAIFALIKTPTATDLVIHAIVFTAVLTYNVFTGSRRL